MRRLLTAGRASPHGSCSRAGGSPPGTSCAVISHHSLPPIASKQTRAASSSLRPPARQACPRCAARHSGGRYGGCPPATSTSVSATATGSARPAPAATTRRSGWPPWCPDRRRAVDTGPRPPAARLGGSLRAIVTAVDVCTGLLVTVASTPLWTRREQRLELVMPGRYRRSPFTAAIFPKSRRSPLLISDRRARAGCSQPPEAPSGTTSRRAAMTLATACPSRPGAARQAGASAPPGTWPPAATPAHPSSPSRDTPCPALACASRRLPQES